MKNKFLTMCVVATILMTVVASPILALPSYKYLPKPADLPKTCHDIQPSCKDTDKIESYQDQGIKSYTASVFCPSQCCPGCDCTPGMKIGSLDFEYSPFKGDFGGTSLGAGGAVIRGGFKIDSGLNICPKYTLSWLQYYEETGYSNNKKIDGNPCYPNHTIAGVTAALFDMPVDKFSSGAIKVEFESALVCLDAANKKICYIGSFFWGYENKVDPTNSVTGIYPWFWTPGLTTAFKNQFASEYSDWTLTEGCCMYIVPTPGSIMLLAIGLAIMRKRHYAA